MARAPQKINSFIVFDFETGGLDKKDRLHCQKYPVTEFAAVGLHGVTLDQIIKYENLVKPYDPKLTYDPEAAQLTGITKAMCEAEGIELGQLVEDIKQLVGETNWSNSRSARPILVGHNVGFDRHFLCDIFARCKEDLSVLFSGENDNKGNFIPDAIDTEDLAKQCWAEITDTDTKFQLKHCCERAAIEFFDGHRAINDVLPSADLLRYFSARLRSGTSDIKVSDGRASIHRTTFEW